MIGSRSSWPESERSIEEKKGTTSWIGKNVFLVFGQSSAEEHKIEMKKPVTMRVGVRVGMMVKGEEERERREERREKKEATRRGESGLRVNG